MTERHVTDTMLTSALRSYLPNAAPNGTGERMAVALGRASQQRPLPSVLAYLTDVDPIGRRRRLLVAAALLVVAATVGAVTVGALRSRPHVPPDLSLEPPRDVQAYVVSAVQESPIVRRPMAITAIADRGQTRRGEPITGPVKTRILLDAVGSVRIEQFDSTSATDPATYKIVTAGRIGELAHQGPESVWVEEPFDGTPRDWVSLVLSAYVGTADRFGCEMLEPDPTSHWQYVGLEYIVGRPVHHVRCAGELWIDVETRLIMRSYGPLLPDGRPADETTRTIEVTALEFGDQPARLFDPSAPADLRRVSRDEQRAYEDRVDAENACKADPVCSAPTAALVTPPPAADEERPGDVNAIVDAARAAREHLPPMQVAVQRWRSKGGTVGTDRLAFESPARFRVDWSGDALAGTPARTSIWAGDAGVWETRTDDRGNTLWLRLTNGRNLVDARSMWVEGFLFTLPDCGPVGGLPAGVAGPHWRQLGVDRVGSYIADHITCADPEQTWTLDGSEYACGCTGQEFWIDRASHLIVRRMVPADGNTGVEVREVVDLRLGSSPDAIFRPPDGATIDVQPTPDPDATPEPNHPPTPAPQPSQAQ